MQLVYAGGGGGVDKVRVRVRPEPGVTTPAHCGRPPDDLHHGQGHPDGCDLIGAGAQAVPETQTTFNCHWEQVVIH